MRLTAHLVLVGLPGAGKTTVGRALAARLGVRFVDFDTEIVKRAGMPVAEIFARRGESWFRALEGDVTRSVAHEDPAVLAPGGGWIMQPALVDLLRPPARLVHLRVTPATALSRMADGIALRPLLSAGDPTDRVVTLWEARRSAYESADIEIETESLDIEGVTNAVLRLIG